MSVKKEMFVRDDTESSLRILAEKFNNSSNSDCYQVLDEVLRIIKESSSFDKLQIGEFLSVIKNSVNVIKLENQLRTDIRCRESLCILFSIYINEELLRNEKGSLETINRISTIIDPFIEDQNYVIKIFRKVSQIINRLGTVLKDNHTVKMLIRKYIDKDIFKCKRTRFSEFRELLVVYNFWYSNLDEKLEKKFLLNLVVNFLSNNPEHTNLLKSQLKWRNEDKRKTKVKAEIQQKQKLHIDPKVITIDDDDDGDDVELVIESPQSNEMKNESILKADNVDNRFYCRLYNFAPSLKSIQLDVVETNLSFDVDNKDEAFVKFVLGSSNRNFNDLNENTDKIIAKETIAMLISRLQEHLSTCKKSTILRFLHDFVWSLKTFSHNLKASEIRQNVSKVLSMLHESKSLNFQYNDLNVDECLSSLISLYIDVELSLYQIEKKSEETLKRISKVLDVSSGNDFFLIEVLRKVTRFASLKELTKCKKIAKAIFRKYFTNEQKSSCRFLTNKEFLEYCIVYNLWYSIIDNQPERDILLDMVSNFISPNVENIKLLKLQLKSEGKGSIIHVALKTSKQILEDALNANKNIIVEEEIIIDDDDLIIISDDEQEPTAAISSSNESCSLVLQDFIKSENIEVALKVEKLSLTDAKLQEISDIERDECIKITDMSVVIPIAKVELIDDNLELCFEMKDLSSSSRNTSFSEELVEDSTLNSEKKSVILSNEKANSESDKNNILLKECDLNTLPLKKPIVNSPCLEKIICDNIPSTSKNIPLLSKETRNENHESISNIPNTSSNSLFVKKIEKKTPTTNVSTVLNSKNLVKYSTVESPDSTSPSDTDHSFSSVSSQCDDEEYGSKTIKDTVKYLENLQAEIQKPKEVIPTTSFKSKSFINLPKQSLSNQELTKDQNIAEKDAKLLSKKIISTNSYYDLKMDQKKDFKISPEYSRCQPGQSSDFLLKKNERIQAPDISSTSGDDNSSEDFTLDSIKNSLNQRHERDSTRERIEMIFKQEFENQTHSKEELLLKSPESELIEKRTENQPPCIIPETDSIQFNTDSDTDSGFKSENDCVRKSPFNNDFESSDDASETPAIDSPKSIINIDGEIKDEDIVSEITIKSEDKINDSPEETDSRIVINSNIVDPSAMYLNLDDFNSSFGSDESYFYVDENTLKDFSANKLERNLLSDKEESLGLLEHSDEKNHLNGLDGNFLLFDNPFYSPTRTNPDRDRDPYLPMNYNDIYLSDNPDNPDLKMIDPSATYLSQNNTSTTQPKSNIEEGSLTPYTMDNEFTPSETLKDYVESIIDSLNDSYQKQTEDNEQIVNTLLDDFTTSKIFDQTKTVIDDDFIDKKEIPKEIENITDTTVSQNIEKSDVPSKNPINIVDSKKDEKTSLCKTLVTLEKHEVDVPDESSTDCVGKLNLKISSFSSSSKKRKRTDPVKIIKVEERLSVKPIYSIFPNPVINPLAVKKAFENGLKPPYNQNSKRLRFCDEIFDLSPDSSPCSIDSPSSLSPSENSQTICSLKNFSETKMNKNKRIETSIPIKTKSSMKSFLDKEVVFSAKKIKSNQNKTYKYSYINKNR